MTQPQKKIDVLRANCAAGDYYAALRLAASFPRLGRHTDDIKAAWSAASRPGFYREIAKDPVELVANGVDALVEAYQLPGTVWPDFDPARIKDLVG